jgi:hypothetical protein
VSIVVSLYAKNALKKWGLIKPTHGDTYQEALQNGVLVLELLNKAQGKSLPLPLIADKV